MSTKTQNSHWIQIAQVIWRKRSLVIRGLFCWVLGLIVFMNQDRETFDLRLRIRGPFLQHDKILLVNITEREWSLIQGSNSANLTNTDLSLLSDHFFWNEDTWVQILRKTLTLQPKVIGITFLFHPNMKTQNLSISDLEILNDPKIVWASSVSADGTVIKPSFLVRETNQTGVMDFSPDSDGVLRRAAGSALPMPHMASMLANEYIGSQKPNFDFNLIVNYQGPPDTFESISLYELLTEPADSQRLNNRIIIFGSHNFNSHGFQSPLGPMLESEALANVVDNLIYSRFVNHFPRSIYLLLLLGIIVLSSWTVFRFNQWVSFSIHAFLALFALSFSAWSFDNLNLLLPVVPLLVVVASSYMIYLSFQSNLNEQRAWNLEKERNSYLELESLKQNFVSLFSHDLKTPIAKIQGTIERISRTRAVDQQLSSDLEILRNASLDLNRYIQSILNLSRVEASDFKLNHSPSDINEISERVAESLSSFAEEKGISLSLNLEPMFTAEFDAILIQEVIQNLIENAIKYTPKGGFVEVSTQEDENGYIHFEVRDTGPGIPEDDLQNVWNKFFRGADDPTEERKGSGLGLYLVKFFIELHGGSVFIESEVNVGTRVGFLLPVEPKLAQDKG